jgi:VWFA-related protein
LGRNPGRNRIVALLLLCATAALWAQQNDASQTTLRARSALVQVPVLVTSKAGEVVFGLTAGDFMLTDNGTPQHLDVDADTDSQPLALAVVVETGEAGVRHFSDYGSLDAILDALIGNVEHRVAVIGFDSMPHLLMDFSSKTSVAAQRLAHLEAGDRGAAILDGVAFAVSQLQKQPVRYRRAILLLSETIDQGSYTTRAKALQLISDTNTAIYSFAFSSAHSAMSHEAGKFNNGTPGPAHGCFSRDGADPEYEGHYNKQVLDCISQLAPPIRLATMAFLGAHDALRVKTAESIAQLTGGEFFAFKDAKSLKAGMIELSNHVPNRYVLSFRPSSLTPGLHALHLELDRQTKDRRHVELKYRSEYWIDEEEAR